MLPPLCLRGTENQAAYYFLTSDVTRKQGMSFWIRVTQAAIFVAESLLSADTNCGWSDTIVVEFSFLAFIFKLTYNGVTHANLLRFSALSKPLHPHMEQVTGVEPASSGWEPDILPLNYTCIGRYDTAVSPFTKNSWNLLTILHPPYHADEPLSSQGCYGKVILRR